MKSDRHAYLIMAHNEPQLLRCLLELLDDSHNDIYLHIDCKASYIKDEVVASWVHQARLVMVPRMHVVWGAYSQVSCELNLMKVSVERPHAYYHFLSGIDLPLMTQREIREFFDAHSGQEFLSWMEDEEYLLNCRDRVKYYYPLQQVIGRAGNRGQQLLYDLRKYSLALQRRLEVDRLKGWDRECAKGGFWFSITQDMMDWLLSQEDWIRKACRYTICADEIYVQTVALSSPYRENVVNNDLRMIDWDRGSPYTFRREDYPALMNSGRLFARKFSWNTDREIIGMIRREILTRQRIQQKEEANG